MSPSVAAISVGDSLRRGLDNLIDVARVAKASGTERT
jgi:hypothetical protein